MRKNRKTICGLTATLPTCEFKTHRQTSSAMQKVRFTLWMDEDVLKAAKVRPSESGVTPSRVIADAARTILIDNPAKRRELAFCRRLRGSLRSSNGWTDDGVMTSRC